MPHASTSTLTLWTIQPVEFLKLLERRRPVRADWKHTCRDYERPYRWMSQQMARRGICRPGTAPLWAWYAYSGIARRRPDLRCGWHLPRGTRGVRIEFTAPADKVLLSDFEMWHAVLNDWYLERDEQESQQHDKRRPSRKQIEKSWQRIFDLEFGSEEYWFAPAERQIQACIPSLSKSQIKEIRPFTAR